MCMGRRWKTARGVDPEIIDQARLSSICAWCKQHIPLDAPVVTIGMKLEPDNGMLAKEGLFIEMPVPGGDRTVVALVSQQNSPAKEEGKDLMFMVCSDPCAQAVREALKLPG